MKHSVCIIDELYRRAKVTFNSADKIKIMPVEQDEGLLAQAVKKHGAGAVVVGAEPYKNELYSSLPQGGLIARFGVGHDGINKEKASHYGLIVTNTPDVLDDSVAEQAVWLMGTLARKIPQYDSNMKNDKWILLPGYELKRKKLLILGCGRIGCRVARIAAYGLQMQVFGYDSVSKDNEILRKKWGIQKMKNSLTDALAEADFVSVHLPATKDTQNFVNQEFLSKMKPTSFLINTARGSIVDENALYDAVKSGQIAGAGLDVFQREPYAPLNPGKDLRRLPQVVLSPHIGSNTVEASHRMAVCVLDNIYAWLSGDYGRLNVVNAEVWQNL